MAVPTDQGVGGTVVGELGEGAGAFGAYVAGVAPEGLCDLLVRVGNHVAAIHHDAFASARAGRCAMSHGAL